MKILISLIILLNALQSHPHTFIEVYPNIKIKNNFITNIKFIWKLDEMTSSMMIMEFDGNANGKIDSSEQEHIYKNYFISLSDYNFYTEITIDGKIQKFPKPEKFTSFIENNRLCYSFEINGKFDKNKTYFDFGDTDFFIAMILKKSFVKINDVTPIVSDLDNDFYFGYRLEFK